MTGRDPLKIDALVRAARRGDRDAFGELVKEFASSLLYFFAVRGADPDAAQDGVQETCVRAYQSLGKYDGSSPFASWLYGIARNVHLQSNRSARKHRHEPVLPSDALSSEDPTATLEQDEQRAAIRRSLAALPDRMQLVLQLRFIDRKSCGEIAELLGTTVSAVSPLIYRAKSALRKHLEPKLESKESSP